MMRFMKRRHAGCLRKRFPLEAEIETLGSTLKRQGKVEFRSYFAKQKTRLRLAVTLMALLELMRLGKARLRDTAKGLVIEGEYNEQS